MSEPHWSMIDKNALQAIIVPLRVILSLNFLVSICDRFGLWGPHGIGNVSWGDWQHFLQFIAALDKFAPSRFVPTLGFVETGLEAMLALALLIGLAPRVVAWTTVALLATFAATMSAALGTSVAAIYGAFSALGAALLLGGVTERLERATPLNSFRAASRTEVRQRQPSG